MTATQSLELDEMVNLRNDSDHDVSLAWGYTNDGKTWSPRQWIIRPGDTRMVAAGAARNLFGDWRAAEQPYYGQADPRNPHSPKTQINSRAKELQRLRVVWSCDPEDDLRDRMPKVTIFDGSGAAVTQVIDSHDSADATMLKNEDAEYLRYQAVDLQKRLAQIEELLKDSSLVPSAPGTVEEDTPPPLLQGGGRASKGR